MSRRQSVISNSLGREKEMNGRNIDGELLAHDIECGKQNGKDCTCGIFGPVAPNFRGRGSHIDPTARIHPSVSIGSNVSIGVGVIIAEDVIIDSGATIWHYANILPNAVIKKDAMIAAYCQIERSVVVGKRTRIQPYAAPGSGTVIGSDVYFGPYSCVANAPYPPCKQLEGGIIGNGAIIGMAVYIFPGVKIGKNSVVGSGSLVTHDIPPNEVWYGRPIAYACGRDSYDKKRSSWEMGELVLDTKPKYKLVQRMPDEPEADPKW